MNTSKKNTTPLTTLFTLGLTALMGMGGCDIELGWPDCNDPDNANSSPNCAETGGDEGENDEPDDEDAPDYKECRQRVAQAGQTPVLWEEYAAYAPLAHNSWDDWWFLEKSRPWHNGLPNMTEYTNQNPSEVRTGLIGNFAFYDSVSLPTTHPRPPIAYSLLAQVLNVTKFLFRYNAYGEPCCSLEHNGIPANSDCREIVEQRGTLPAKGYSRIDGSVTSDSPGDISLSASESFCLSNEGDFDFQVAHNLSQDRNGLAWGNFKFYQFILEYLILNFVEETHPVVEWMLTHIGAVEPTWKWSEFGYTGACSFGASVEYRVEGFYPNDNGIDVWRDEGWYSYKECPIPYYAVLPDFEEEGEEFEEIEGYCALEHWMLQTLPFGPYDWTPLDVYPLDDQGVPNHFIVDLDYTSPELQQDWFDSIKLGPNPSGGPGSALITANRLGDEFLSKFDLVEGDVLLNIAGVDTREYTPQLKKQVVEAMVKKAIVNQIIIVVAQRDPLEIHRSLDQRGPVRLHRYVMTTNGEPHTQTLN